MLEYIDLLIEIGEKLDNGQYRLSIASEPAGETEDVFILGVSEREMGSILKTLSLGARLSRAFSVPHLIRGFSREQQALIDFGRKLFDGLTQSQAIRSCYDRTVHTMLADRDKGIRIRLAVKEPSLQAIPWELLHDGERFLAVSGLTPMVRYVKLGRPLGSLEAQTPLRLLVAIASPKDQAQLDVAKERHVIEKALQKSHDLIETVFLPEASFRKLSRELLTALAQHRPYHILHFIGHGRYNAGEGELVFEREETRTSDYVDGQTLGNVLNRHRYLRLVVLNACEGAEVGTKDPFSSIALSLLKAGVPAVVAMQFPISDQAAIQFSDEFYHSLSLGFPVDVALGDARVQMHAIEGSVEFATPVLYTHTRDGQLFDVTDLSEPAIGTVGDRVEQKRLDKERGDLGGQTVPNAIWRRISRIIRILMNLEKPSTLGWFLLGFISAGIAVILFRQPLHCWIEYRVSEAVVSLLVVLAGIAAAAFTQFIPSNVKRVLQVLIGGIASALVLSLIVFPFLDPPAEKVCFPRSALTPTSAPEPTPTVATPSSVPVIATSTNTKTAIAEPTETPSHTPSVTVTSTETPADTLTATVRSTEISTPTPTATTTPTGTPTPTPTSSDTPMPTSCPPHASFVEDVTIPDGTNLPPGEPFTKTWRMRSDGCVAWPVGTTWVFVSGEQMGAPASVPVPDTPLGGMADISVALIAPDTPGTYKGNWQMQGPDGTRLGDQVYVTIVVPTPAPIATPTATDTPLPLTPAPRPPTATKPIPTPP